MYKIEWIAVKTAAANERNTVGSIAFHYEWNIWHQQSQMQTTMSVLEFFAISSFSSFCCDGIGVFNKSG